MASIGGGMENHIRGKRLASVLSITRMASMDGGMDNNIHDKHEDKGCNTLLRGGSTTANEVRRWKNIQGSIMVLYIKP